MKDMVIQYAFCALIASTAAMPKSRSSSTCEVENTLALVERAVPRRDGDLGFLIDSAIVELLIVDVECTLAWLSARPAVLSRLLESWQHTVFTDYAGDKSDMLRLLHSTLIRRLRGVPKTTSPDAWAAKLQILEAIKNVRIRTID